MEEVITTKTTTETTAAAAEGRGRVLTSMWEHTAAGYAIAMLRTNGEANQEYRIPDP
jgi:hypothetical protein